MTKHLTLIAFIIASLQAFAIDTKVPELHWTLPTTLEGIRQERANLKIEEEPMPVSIMCQGRGEQGVQVDVDKPERYWTVKRDMTLASVPYIALGIALHAVKRDVRKVNSDINDGFNNKVDDYLQYAPLALTYGLKATGYQGRSQWGRLLVSNAFSAAIMAALACAAMLIPSFYIKERDYIDSKPSKTKPFLSLLQTFRNAQFRRFVYSDVIYFFALTLFQTGLAFYETKLMEIEDSWTFVLTATMTAISVLLYPVVNRLAPKIGKKRLIIVGFFTYAAVFLITFLCGKGLYWGFIIAVFAAVPMAILGILPQACVADVAELSRLETGEDRSGMFFAARTFAFKMGQALAMVVFTSMTISKTPQSYRNTALMATVTCLIGASLFFLYNEKMILRKIKNLKGEENI